MRIVAFITETAPVQRILTHIGEPAEPPRIAPARGPPAWEGPLVAATPSWAALAELSSEHVFDQEFHSNMGPLQDRRCGATRRFPRRPWPCLAMP